MGEDEGSNGEQCEDGSSAPIESTGDDAVTHTLSPSNNDENIAEEQAASPSNQPMEQQQQQQSSSSSSSSSLEEKSSGATTATEGTRNETKIDTQDSEGSNQEATNIEKQTEGNNTIKSINLACNIFQ